MFKKFSFFFYQILKIFDNILTYSINKSFLSWFKESVKAGFVSQANFDALIYENTPKKLLELLISKKLPDDDDWIKRLNINDR